MFLRQSTAQAINFGPFLDSTDGVTAEPSLTIAQADMQLSKDGGAYAQKSAAGNATHDSDGHYTTTLSTTDTATVGILKLQVNVTGALPVFERFYVVTQPIYDALYAGTATGLLPANLTQINGTAQSATDLQDFADAGYDPATNKVEGVKLVDTTTTNADMRGTDSAATAAALATVDGIVDAILVDTGTTLPATLTTIDGIVDAILVDTDTTIPGLIAGLNDITVADILTTQMTQSYAADGTAPTLAQALFAIQQFLQERAVSGTTVTVRQLDGSTTAMTFTLDDGTSPTSITRAT